MSTGDSHTCALVSDGGIFCWGDNRGGDLGIGNGNQQLLPVSVNLGASSTNAHYLIGNMNVSHHGNRGRLKKRGARYIQCYDILCCPMCLALAVSGWGKNSDSM